MANDGAVRSRPMCFSERSRGRSCSRIPVFEDFVSQEIVIAETGFGWSTWSMARLATIVPSLSPLTESPATSPNTKIPFTTRCPNWVCFANSASI